MKAIVAEIDKKQMLVITEKGDFIKVKRKMSAGIGDEIEVQPRKMYPVYRRVASLAACLIACIMLSTGVYAYYTPYSYVSVDINPSIAMSLNRFERVISVNPLNEDAVNLIKDIKGLKNREIDSALSEIIKSAADKGYIEENEENQVMVVVSSKTPEQEKELTEVVAKAAEKELAKVNDDYGVMVEKTTVEHYKEALSQKVSPGKEILADKLRKVIPEIKDEEVKDMSVREVVKLIKEGRKEEKAAVKEDKKAEKEDAKEAKAVEKDKEKEKNKDKDKNKDKNTKEQAVNTKDNGKEKGNGAVKATTESKDKGTDSKVKPASDMNKDKGEAKGKDSEMTTAPETKDTTDADEDSDARQEESSKEDKDKKDKNGSEDKGGQKQDNGGEKDNKDKGGK